MSPRVKENSFFKKFLPKFFGEETRKREKYLRLENFLCKGYENSSLIDFKMGKLTYG